MKAGYTSARPLSAAHQAFTQNSLVDEIAQIPVMGPSLHVQRLISHIAPLRRYSAVGRDHTHPASAPFGGVNLNDGKSVELAHSLEIAARSRPDT